MNKHFIEEYKEYHDQQTTTDPRYPEIMAIATLGFSLGRENNLRLLPENLYHNFYIILVGPSTLSHKSTSVKLWFKLIDQGYRAPYHVSLDSFYRYLSENPKTILYFDEMDRFITRAKRRRATSQFADELNALYESPNKLTIQFNKLMTRENPKGVLHIENTYPFVIGCTTMDELKEVINYRMFRTGLLTRFLFVVTSEAVYTASRMLEERKLLDIEKKREELKAYLNKLSKTHIVFTWAEEARNCLQEYMVSMIERSKDNGMSTAIIARAERHIIKTADIYALNETEIPEPSEEQEIRAEVRKGSVEKATSFIGKCIEDAIEIQKSVPQRKRK